MTIVRVYPESKHVNPLIEKVVTTLEGHDSIRVAFLFGSTASGADRKDSDLDVGVASHGELSAAQKLSLMDDLAVATGRPVDLVDLWSASPVILAQVMTNGSCIIKKDTALFAALLKKLWYNQADLMPNIDLILRKRREKFLRG